MFRLMSLVLFATAVGASTNAASAESEVPENKQALATSPRALVEMLSDVAFLPPKEYAERIREEQEAPQVDRPAYDVPFETAFVRNRQLLGYTVAANGIGAPAMSVPLFHSSATGLPVGSHFMAAPGADKALYELAFELEAAQPWAERRPLLPLS